MSSTRRSFLRSSLVLLPLVAVDPQQLIWRADRQTEREIKVFVKALRKTMRRMFREAVDDSGVDWLGVPVSAAGLTTDTTVLPQAVRQAANYQSGTFTIPAAISFVRLFANIGLDDKLAVGRLCDLVLERSADGVTFQERGGFGWTSYGPEGYHAIGKDGRPIDNPDPSLGYHVEPGDDTQQFRLLLTLPQPLTLGATVSVTTQ